MNVTRQRIAELKKLHHEVVSIVGAQALQGTPLTWAVVLQFYSQFGIETGEIGILNEDVKAAYEEVRKGGKTFIFIKDSYLLPAGADSLDVLQHAELLGKHAAVRARFEARADTPMSAYDRLRVANEGVR
ncbi:hypothetical protein CcrColossus_gp431 [Caulobacter phage CcrColossus]|uniref:Uncharacterized protein n=1 Tax=Caulobacter phage CcrColossus TaxID=1211640 RepID=K4JT37_9CAUD|nr:hypothetical protein CcrColossus_gp431 [Caulobacter phage CcrColossus]AFU88301.1 hypothetical protein CcrColossus_gp431 [Caulobacter phage CcrColossus]